MKKILSDHNLEQQLLQAAKTDYQSYADVAKLAKQFNIKAGAVYLVLKHHSFIKQNETTEYRVLDAYYRYNGNLRMIVDEVGLNVWICAKTLEKLGLSPNWVSYKQRLETGEIGDFGEHEFKRLVPSALDMNMNYRMNQEGYDFIVNGKTIDVKSSEPRDRGGNYGVRVNKAERKPDFYCYFLMKEKGNREAGYHVLLVPGEIVPTAQQQIHIIAKHKIGSNAPSEIYWDFEIEPVALEAFLENM